MSLIAVRLVFDDLGVMVEANAGGFVKVDDADFFADKLSEPDGGRIADPQIPCRIHRESWVVWDI